LARAIQIDLLRRAGQYEEAVELLDLPVATTNDVLLSVMSFESHLFREQDAGCYTTQNALDFAQPAQP